MCGICGQVHERGRPVERAVLERMNDLIRHRGPDSDGFYLDGNAGLAARRLAIIDLVSGDQPIPNEDETIWVVLNGEIFNFPDLRPDLEARGHKFRSHSDTECIVHLYEEHGPACVEHLRGMFAIALWDAAAQRLLLARDRLGKKPLYYRQDGSTLTFSSELPSLLAGLSSRPALDLGAIDLYLAMQYIPEPWTPFEGVFKLPAAHCMTWQAGRATIERYWQLNYEPKLVGRPEALQAELRERVREAVRLRLISDVPLGAHLSGGIDSSIVVSQMAELSSQPVKTFSIGFEEQGFSELEFARAVADRYATDHHEFRVSYGDVPRALRQVVGHLGEPMADPSALPMYYLSGLTREHVTVALNGDGGDESFAGYQRYWLDPWADRYAALPAVLTRRLIPWLVQPLSAAGAGPVGSNLIDGVKRLRQTVETDRRASILRWGSYFSPAQRCELWREEVGSRFDFGRPESLLAAEFERAPASGFLDRTLFVDLSTYLPGDLLLKADRMTMAASLEGRSPFLDHQLVEWAARLPERYKVRGSGGKVLLRRAFADTLPEGIQRRGKQGFGIPVGSWLRGPLASWTEDLLHDPQRPLARWFRPQAIDRLLDEHSRGRVDHGKRIWALIILALWAETFEVSAE
jgi:asparagine synthase (glutamine-hydrolysing)